MSESINGLNILPIHPFPARMAPSIVWENLPIGSKPLRILDPMAGSGTTLVITKARGHQAIGCDIDPLAVMIARAWCTNIEVEKLTKLAESILRQAVERADRLSLDTAYPPQADDETKQFIEFWFDDNNRIRLTALSDCISQIENQNDKNILFTAFSRLIITKISGVSLAMDVSHSRPHRKYEKAPINPFDKFLNAVDYIIKKAPFRDNDLSLPPVHIIKGDARSIPIESDSIDLIITSPPYLNAIDYIRGHKLSLVWMGHLIKNLRAIRSNNIGTEYSLLTIENNEYSGILSHIGDVSNMKSYGYNMIIHYLNDMGTAISECRRVLKGQGSAIFVIGNSAIHGIPVKNSEALIRLAINRGFKLESMLSRSIPESKRYLPPPNSDTAGDKMSTRMREEVILKFVVV